MAHVRTYNPSVRVGNWNEDLQLEEDTLKDFLDRREKGQLLIQQTNSVIGKMDGPIKLSTSSDGTVCFGDTVMILNRGNPDRKIYGVGQYPRDDSVLAIHIANPKAASLVTGPEPIAATGSKKLAPCFRTAFKIVPADDYGKMGDKLRYGQPFSFVTASPEAGELYLYSDTVLFNRAAPKSRNQVVHLVPEHNFKTAWQIEHKNPLLRLEYESTPVLANDDCIIKHCKTGQNLCVEEKHFTPTFFGNEYEMSAKTNLDSHKADEAINIFQLVMAVAGDMQYPMVVNSSGEQCAEDIAPSVQ